uniref:Uncharacterized protein n=1 Tax=Heterorhabditis bacteriophora TaxID=37862 RepID=A0A1I7X322_HETBA
MKFSNIEKLTQPLTNLSHSNRRSEDVTCQNCRSVDRNGSSSQHGERARQTQRTFSNIPQHKTCTDR